MIRILGKILHLHCKFRLIMDNNASDIFQTRLSIVTLPSDYPITTRLVWRSSPCLGALTLQASIYAILFRAVSSNTLRRVLFFSRGLVPQANAPDKRKCMRNRNAASLATLSCCHWFPLKRLAALKYLLL